MSYLKYYADENARHPLFHKTRCSKDEVLEAIRRLWLHFAGRKALKFFSGGVLYTSPKVGWTSGNRVSCANLYSITLNTDGLNWLLVLHELAHSLDHLREKQGRRSSETVWHSKHHQRWVDRLVAYVTDLGWLTGNLAHELALRDVAAATRKKLAARGPSIDERIAHREEQVARLEKKVRALNTRIKTAKRSLTALRISARKRSVDLTVARECPTTLEAQPGDPK